LIKSPIFATNWQKIAEICDNNIDPRASKNLAKRRSRRQKRPGLPDFSWYKIPKQEKICQMTINYTK
jgi:hypothetical protein